jgi:hypothetical protein
MEQFVGLDVRVPPAGFRRSGELRAQGGDLAFRFRRPTDGVAGNGLALGSLPPQPVDVPLGSLDGSSDAPPPLD